jgi:hypothetical protein
LVENLPADRVDDLFGTDVAGQLRWKDLRAELVSLAGKGFPLPDTMTDTQWKQISKITCAYIRLK